MSKSQHGAPPVSVHAAAREDEITPLDVMLAAMRWAHEEAERACAERACAERAGTSDENASDTSKRIQSLWSLALGAAKDAAPYLHMRLATFTPRDPATKSHEEWLADMERAAVESARN